MSLDSPRWPELRDLLSLLPKCWCKKSEPPFLATVKYMLTIYAGIRAADTTEGNEGTQHKCTLKASGISLTVHYF